MRRDTFSDEVRQVQRWSGTSPEIQRDIPTANMQNGNWQCKTNVLLFQRTCMILRLSSAKTTVHDLRAQGDSQCEFHWPEYPYTGDWNWDRDSLVWCSLCTCWESPVVLQGHQDNRTSWPESPASLVSGPCPAWSIGLPHASGHTAILTILTPYNHNY